MAGRWNRKPLVPPYSPLREPLQMAGCICICSLPACPSVPHETAEPSPAFCVPRAGVGLQHSPALQAPVAGQGPGCWTCPHQWLQHCWPSTQCKGAVCMHVLRTGCLVLLPITNFSWLKEKEIHLRIVREVTDSHVQQNSLSSLRNRTRHQLTGYQGGFGTLFSWSHCFLQLTRSNNTKKKITPAP